ncbi:hypothetical protein BT96DRAFT_875217 [Gymnopus androsaceus JB14]|uniref:G domain-containing protein n=1 Tax=Gymnopus androsaceus JB14 TaxID=1447944 RepID=A0A6A4I8G6_9AGAR|nr:hypothetical protein BT96DRAFT_875217 [Gymnopus androsaceus JB14]
MSSSSSEPLAAVGSVSNAPEKFANVSQTVKEYCPRIRVLVMGRRNAGKTTLLKKMTNTVFYGSLSHYGSLNHQPMTKTVYTLSLDVHLCSDNDYVFHDSKGMEAGSSDELVVLREFIQRKRKMKALSQRLHVIW